MLFKNQTIVITGGASGIGLAVAKKVSENDVSVENRKRMLWWRIATQA